MRIVQTGIRPLGFFVAVIGFLLPVSYHSSDAQPVIPYSGAETSLSDRWEWAVSQDDPTGGFWIGYSIEKWMRQRSFIGSFGAWKSGAESPFYELIGAPASAAGTLPRESRTRYINGEGHFRQGKDKKNEELELKDVAVLFYFRNGRAAPSEIEISNISLAVDLEDRTLFWLGKTTQDESVAHLIDQYERISSTDVREDAIRAVGLHEASPGIFSFLTGIIESERNASLREEAVFWVGQQDTEEALELLRRLIREEDSGDVLEKAVFALSQLTMPEALDELITLATGKGPTEVRKKAIFWLGQKASNKAKETLDKVIEEKDDVEVQKAAVFALSQLPEEEAIPKLIEVASTHFHVDVRRAAIFWLGETGDPRAVDFLVSLVKD